MRIPLLTFYRLIYYPLGIGTNALLIIFLLMAMQDGVNIQIMCVIMCYEDDFPKLATLKSAEDMNNDGGGMAWISQKDGLVHWKKGISAEEMFDLIQKQKIQLPIIIHFKLWWY